MYKTGDRLTEWQCHNIIDYLTISTEIAKIKEDDRFNSGTSSINNALRGSTLSVHTVKVINHFHELAVKAKAKREQP